MRKFCFIPKNNNKFIQSQIWEYCVASELETIGKSVINWQNKEIKRFIVEKIDDTYAFCKHLSNLKNKTSRFKVRLEIAKFYNWRLAPNLA